MRVNHVGEVCAQALYNGASARVRATRRFGRNSSTRHVKRPTTLPGPSNADCANSTHTRACLNPALVRRLVRDRPARGDARATLISLGFVVETERQVEQHLESPICSGLPVGDSGFARDRSADEGRRSTPWRGRAGRRGSDSLPAPVRWAMRLDRPPHDNRRAPHLQRASERRALRRALISKLVVISAVLANMMVAEQYLSCDIFTARLDHASVSAGPVTTKCRWIFVNTFGSAGSALRGDDHLARRAPRDDLAAGSAPRRKRCSRLCRRAPSPSVAGRGCDPPPSGAPSIISRWPLPVSAENAMPFAGIQLIVHSIVWSSGARTDCGPLRADCAQHRAGASCASNASSQIIAAQQKRPYTHSHAVIEPSAMRWLWLRKSSHPTFVSSTSSIGGFSPGQQCLGLFSWGFSAPCRGYDPAPQM